MVCYVNDIQDTVGTYTTGYFQDISSGYYSTIGAAHTGTSTYGTYFTGFIYSVKFWNIVTQPRSGIDGQNPCPDSSCTRCPIGTEECIPTCEI